MQQSVFTFSSSADKPNKFVKAFSAFADEVMANFIAEKKPRTLAWMLEKFKPHAEAAGLASESQRYVYVTAHSFPRSFGT